MRRVLLFAGALALGDVAWAAVRDAGGTIKQPGISNGDLAPRARTTIDISSFYGEVVPADQP